MEPITVLYILTGTVLMAGITFLFRKTYQLSVLKASLAPLCLTLAGVASVLLMFFIENGRFGGISFFGAVFFVPILLFPFALLLKIRYRSYLDVAAPCVCAMLTVMKFNCIRAGCCAGMILRHNEQGEPIRFPSQISEMILAALIAVILCVFIKTNLLTDRIYPMFMVLYGATRFVMNLLRETTEVAFGLAIGNIWAILSFLIGCAWLITASVIRKKKQINKL